MLLCRWTKWLIYYQDLLSPTPLQSIFTTTSYDEAWTCVAVFVFVILSLADQHRSHHHSAGEWVAVLILSPQIMDFERYNHSKSRALRWWIWWYSWSKDRKSLPQGYFSVYLEKISNGIMLSFPKLRRESPYLIGTSLYFENIGNGKDVPSWCTIPCDAGAWRIQHAVY